MKIRCERLGVGENNTDTERELTECQRQLAEARAALRDAEFHIAEWSPTVHAEAWGLEHAAALKAAREAKL